MDQVYIISSSYLWDSNGGAIWAYHYGEELDTSISKLHFGHGDHGLWLQDPCLSCSSSNEDICINRLNSLNNFKTRFINPSGLRLHIFASKLPILSCNNIESYHLHLLIITSNTYFLQMCVLWASRFVFTRLHQKGYNRPCYKENIYQDISITLKGFANFTVLNCHETITSFDNILVQRLCTFTGS